MCSVMYMCFDYDFIKIDIFFFEDFFNINFLLWKNSKNVILNNLLELYVLFVVL